MTAVQARLDLIRREMMGPSSSHDAALRVLQAKLAKKGKHVRAALWHSVVRVCSPWYCSAALARGHRRSCMCAPLCGILLSHTSLL